MPTERPIREHAPADHPVLVSALAFGAGMALGFLVIYFLLASPLIRSIAGLAGNSQPFLEILFGLFLFLGTVGLAGATAGVMGGHAISRFSGAASEERFERRGALSFFLAHAIMALPAVAVVAVASFFNQDIDVSFSKLPTVFGVLGLAYGMIAGLLFGLQTVGIRRTLWVVLAAAAGFGLGGLLLGLSLRGAADLEGAFWRVLAVAVGFLFFGAAGGTALGMVYDGYQEQRQVFPPTTAGRVARGALLVAILLLGFTACANLVTLATINVPDLATQLELPTVSTGWFGAQGEPAGAEAASTSADVRCANGRLTVTENGAPVSKEAWAPCFEDPLVATDAVGAAHALWYTDQVARVLGGTTPGHFVVETVQTDDGTWSEPSIVVRAGEPVQARLSSDAESLYVTWEESGESQTLSMTPYQCEGLPQGTISQAVYTAVRSEEFRPADDPITYCDNQFDRLHFTPNPRSPELPFDDRPLGAFDTVADLVREAQYEVDFVTMQWDAPSEYDSPGDALARGIADLHARVAANPEAYPRGMTVRILLGNLPETAVFSFANQIHHVVTDLRQAGVPTSDPELGWKIEVANYLGSLPHAHSKFLVVDGYHAVAAGFNYSYLHLEEDHPHELAMGMTDMGLGMTGPVAQTVLAAYDDLWRNSETTHCPINPPAMKLLFSLVCVELPSEVSHPPEVLRFVPVAENDSAAFALHHTMAHLESDAALLAAIDAAQESIDLFEVNFSLDTPCLVLSQISELCLGDEYAPVYMLALRDAVLQNDVHIRVMMEESAMNGMENRTGILWLYNHLAAAGKEGNVELRFSAHKMHNKAMLVDQEFLSVGSQNFHYSAWGSPSLTEYNLATDDPLAVEEWLAEYEYWWDRAVPVGEVINRELSALESREE